MAPVVIMLSTIFCAVAAFMRVDPETTSGPTSATMQMSATPERGVLWLQVTAAVLAPRARAYSTAATTYGVRPPLQKAKNTPFHARGRGGSSRRSRTDGY